MFSAFCEFYEDVTSRTWNLAKIIFRFLDNFILWSLKWNKNKQQNKQKYSFTPIPIVSHRDPMLQFLTHI